MHGVHKKITQPNIYRTFGFCGEIIGPQKCPSNALVLFSFDNRAFGNNRKNNSLKGF